MDNWGFEMCKKNRQNYKRMPWKTRKWNWLQELKPFQRLKFRGILQGDSLSSRQFIIAMIPLNQVLRKCTRELQIFKIPGKDQPSNVYGWDKGIWKKWKRTKAPDTNNMNIQTGYRNGIWIWKMCQDNDKKWEKRISRGNRTAKSRIH